MVLLVRIINTDTVCMYSDRSRLLVLILILINKLN